MPNPMLMFFDLSSFGDAPFGKGREEFDLPDRPKALRAESLSANCEGAAFGLLIYLCSTAPAGIGSWDECKVGSAELAEENFSACRFLAAQARERIRPSDRLNHTPKITENMCIFFFSGLCSLAVFTESRLFRSRFADLRFDYTNMLDPHSGWYRRESQITAGIIRSFRKTILSDDGLRFIPAFT
jgi:hypothetical protein